MKSDPITPSIIHSKSGVSIRSSSYNMIFRSSDGLSIRWGETQEDDPDWSPLGPEILDCEISTICHGPREGGPCSFCYKSNGPRGINMTLDQFKRIISIFSPTLTQVALGVGDIDANPDLFPIMKLCREENIIPNITINGSRLNEDTLKQLVDLSGSIGVSIYEEESFLAVDKLLERGASQVNIHQLLSQDTLPKCYNTIDWVNANYPNDSRLAVLLLLLKPRGRATTSGITPLQELGELVNLLEYSRKKNVMLGGDSCCAHSMRKAMEKMDLPQKMKDLARASIEPCEASCFSSYISAEGKYYPCSFAEEQVEGIDVLSVDDFLREVWMHENTVRFRENLIQEGRKCPLWNLELE